MADNLTPKEEFLLNPVEEHNITDAAIASFETNFKHPVKVTVPITPKQDLHGYDHPWPAGGSVNLIPDGTDTENGYVANKFLDVNGGENANGGFYISEYFNISSGEVYTLTVTSNSTAALCVYNENKEFVNGYDLDSSRRLVITMPENAVYARGTQRKGDGTSYCFMLVKGESSAAPTFENYRKYSNICPIEGYIGATIYHTGANLLNGKTVADILKIRKSAQVSLNEDADGKYVRLMTMSGADINLTETLKFKENTRYTIILTGKNESSGVSSTHIRFVYSDGNSTEIYWSAPTEIKTIAVTSAANKTIKAITTLTRTYNTRIYYEKPFGLFEGVVSASLFEEYQGQSIPISWKHAEGTYNFEPIQAGEGDPSPDNVRPISPALTLTRDDNSVLTVYGGSITFRDDGTSVLEDKYWYGLIPNELTVNGGNSNYLAGFHYINASWSLPNPLFTNVGIADKAVLRATNDPDDARACYITLSGASSKWVRVYIRKDLLTSEDANGINEWLLNNPVHIAYPSEASMSYTLSKAETQRVIDAIGDKVITTVYGGTVTLNEDGSADVVSNYVYKRLTGVQWGENPNANNNYIRGYVYLGPNQSGNDTKKLYCDKLYFAGKKNGYTDQEYTLNGLAGNGRALLYITLSQTASEEGVTNANEAISYISNWLSENEVYVCYNLVTPTASYHFPNVGQLKAFLGANNIWSDIGNVNVKYLTQNSATGLEYRGDRALELRRRAMIGDAPTIHTTVGSEETGGLASFKSYIKAPVKKIEIPFGPKQDLHDYDHPWPAGGGKNLFDISNLEDGSIDSNNQKVVSEAAVRTADYVSVLAETQYTFSASTPLTRVLVKFYNSEKAQLSETTWQNLPYTITTPENTAYIRFIFVGSTSPIIPADVSWVQLELGPTATAYEPYENICPIEGHDGCWVLGTRQNLADVYHAKFVGPNAVAVSSFMSYVSDGKIINGGKFGSSAGTGIVFPIEEGETYTLSWNGRLSEGNNYCYELKQCSFDSETMISTKKLSIANANNADISERLSFTFTAQTGYTHVLLLCYSAIKFGSYQENIQLEKGATETTYQAIEKPISLQWNYQGDHSFIPIQEGTGDPSPENVRPIHPGLTITRDDDSVLSVYGGTLTVNNDGTGSLTSTWQKIILDGSQTPAYPWIQVDAMAGALFSSSIGAGRSQNAIRNAQYSMCDSLKFSGSIGNGEKGTWKYGFYSASTYGLEITVDKTVCGTTKDELKAYLAEHPITVVYELAKPITYTLSVTETNRALEALGLTQHIGPIYGGTITINPDGSADVEQTIDIFHLRDVGNASNWSTYVQFFYFSVPTKYLFSNRNAWRIKSNLFFYNYTTSGGGLEYSMTIGANRNLLFNYKSLNKDKTQWVNWVNENDPYVTFELAIPQTYHFSNLEQLKVWLGENNFWCDISDDITVKYWNRG